MKSALWFPSCTQLCPIPDILSIDKVASVSIGNEEGLVSDEDGNVYRVGISSLSISPLITQIQVSQVHCFNSLSLLLGSGQVFIFGQDTQNTTLLGSGVSESSTPIQVLLNSNIIKASLSNHAGLIDSEGSLYTWGSGSHGQLGWSEQSESSPSLVDTKDHFLISEVVCGDYFTVILTSGGYVNLFGSLDGRSKILKKNSKGKIVHYSNGDLDRMPCTFIAAGKDFVSVLTESREVYAFDKFMDLVKLPLPQGLSVESLACSRSMVLALGHKSAGEAVMIEWGPSSKPARADSVCSELASWVGSYYKLEKPYNQHTKLFSSAGSYFTISFSGSTLSPMPLGLRAFGLNPYKRSSESIFTQRNSVLSEDENFRDLRRLYSFGNDDTTIEKIRKFRREHEFTKSLHEVLKPVIEATLRFAFKCVKGEAAVKKHLEKYRAAALIINPIEKILNKRLVTCYLAAFKAVFIYAQEIRGRVVLESKRASELAQAREEKIGEVVSILRDKYFKHLFLAFTLIKDLEMRRLQKQTAVISITQVLISNINSSQSEILHIITKKQNSLKSIQKTLTHLIKSQFQGLISSILTSSKSQIKRSNTLNKAVKDMTNKLKTRETRKIFLKFKSKIEQIKNQSIKQQYFRQIACKSLVLALTYSTIRISRQIFNTLKSIKPRDLKISASKLSKSLKSLIFSQKLKIFKSIQSLYKSFKGLKSLFKVIKKSNKKLKRSTLKQVELFSLTCSKAKTFHSFITLQVIFSKLIQKRLFFSWTNLKKYSKDLSLDIIGGPSYSYFSPKMLKQSSGILRNKKTNSVAFQTSEIQSLTEMKLNSTQRLRKQNSFTTSLNLTSPKAIFSSTSSIETFAKPESTILEKTLKQRKINETKLKLIKKTSKPPLKPPWKPTSTSASTQKLMINSAVRRSQYDLKLKERGKSQTKNGSNEASQFISTPTIPSRTSSRQKISRKKTFETFDSWSTNFRFALLILDNFRVSLMNKRMFESWCRIKYFLKNSPKKPAPKPLDPKMTWQENLFLIGFESLKHLARRVAGRQVFESVLGMD